MTTTQNSASSQDKVIKQISIFCQSTPLQVMADKFTHTNFSGRLKRSNVVATACNISMSQANNILQYCPILKKHFHELEETLIEQGLLSKKRTTARLRKNGTQRLQDLSPAALLNLAGNYMNVKDLSERNNSLRKHLTKNKLMNEVRLRYPTYTASQAYVGLNNTLLVKSVYELVFANILTHAGIPYRYDVDSGIQKKKNNYIIDFEVSFGEHLVFVELAQNLSVDKSCKSTRRIEYAKNIEIKRFEYLRNGKKVHFIDTDKSYNNFYDTIVQWLNSHAPQAVIASFDVAMTKHNESLKHLLDESVESVAFRIIDEYKGLANFKNKHSMVHTHLKQRSEDDFFEIMKIAKMMSEKLRLQKVHTIRYSWPKPDFFTFDKFCLAILDSGLIELLENSEVTSIQEAYQKWFFSYDMHQTWFQRHNIEPPCNQLHPTPQTFYEFKNWEYILHKIKKIA